MCFGYAIGPHHRYMPPPLTLLVRTIALLFHTKPDMPLKGAPAAGAVVSKIRIKARDYADATATAANLNNDIGNGTLLTAFN
eukprot:2101672-Pyramimonas_sp.AAC.1